VTESDVTEARAPQAFYKMHFNIFSTYITLIRLFATHNY